MTDETEAARSRRGPPAPPPRLQHRGSLDPNLITNTTGIPEPRPRTRLPMPRERYHPESERTRSAERVSNAIALRSMPDPPRLIRPSEHLAIIERDAVLRSMDAYGVEPARRPPPLMPSVTVLPGGMRIRPTPTLPAPPQQRVPAPMPPPVIHFPQPPREYKQPASAIALPPPAAATKQPPSLCAAPRTIVIQRPDSRHGFGFTLRHLVVYPPESLQDLYEDARHLAVGAVGAPMDTIFVRSVRPGGPAAAAGLRPGDRVLAVNGEPVACGRARAPYARVVQLVQREPHTLRLTVVPRDHDLLQRYFSEAAYNPESNQRAIEMPAPAPMLTEHESRLFDVYRRPRAALPAPQAPTAIAHSQVKPRDHIDYSNVPSLSPRNTHLGYSNFKHGDLLHSRRESDTSLPSSATESKDSLGSFDSNSTLTGRELDDSIILSRIRKSLEQKEAFLRRPSQPTGWVTPEAPPPIKQKEFYARPQKLQKPAWPPPAVSPPPPASSPTASTQQLAQSNERRNDLEGCSARVDSGTYSGYEELNGTYGTDKTKPKCEKPMFVTTLSNIQESMPTTLVTASIGSISNGSTVPTENSAPSSITSQDSRYPAQLVTARTRQLEAARGGQETRTALNRSELARLSTTRLEPSVALRRREFETRTQRRDARSLDVQPHQDAELDIPMGSSLSGNQLTITGSKYLHCPPPDGYIPETEKVQMRARSNSTGSEGLPMRRHHASDGSHARRRMGLNREQMEAMNRVSLPGDVNGHGETNGTEVDPTTPKAQRPTQLSLAPPESARSSAATTPASPSPSPSTPADSGFIEDTVMRRQKKDAQMGEEERAMRRVSYLKATWGDRLHLENDPEADPEHIALRRMGTGEKKDEEGVSGSGSVEVEADIHGHVQIKMVVSNGKRASDRSWKQVFAVLHGTKLYLYRHHPNQSPAAVSSNTASSGNASVSGGADVGSRDALDVRYSLAALADDYTKRKHVVRVTTAAGAELLLQAEGAADAQRWLQALRRHSAEPPAATTAPAHTLSLSPTRTSLECPSPLPPQRSKKISRTRSPSGPPTPTLPSSPKNKTWKGRMAKQLRRMHGGTGTSPAQSTPAAVSGWLGAPLERCPSDPAHPFVPLAVTLCAGAVEACGLRTIGVYRVPGNAAGVAALAAALDRGEPPPPGDARWSDVHVASSLLKAYLRRLPDPLLTADLYPGFIAADRSPERARELRRLVRALPDAHYETLKYLIQHLRRVVEQSQYNKMEARNLAIVFGPTLVRAASDDMLAMVNDMSSQCRIIESLLTHYEWYFEEDEGEPPSEPPPGEEDLPAAPPPSRDLLIHNVKKIEGKDVSTRDIVSSIISAANRKIQRKPRSGTKSGSGEGRGERGRASVGSSILGSAELSPGGSPPHSPLSSPPHHLTTSLADYDGLPRQQTRHHKVEEESMTALGRGGQELSRHHTHSHTLATFSFDGTGDLVSTLTNTFDQKLRTLNNSSPLDDGNIPYADECQDDSVTACDQGKDSVSVSTPSEGSVHSEERVSPSMRAHELKTAWLARDHRRSSSSSADEPDGRPEKRGPNTTWASKIQHQEDEGNDSEKENCIIPINTTSHENNYTLEKNKLNENNERFNDSEKDIDTASQNSNGDTLPDNDKNIERALYSPVYAKGGLRLANPESVKRNSAVLNDEPQVEKNKKDPSTEGVKLKRSESLNRDSERNEARVLRSESLNCRTESRLQRSESLNKGERFSKLEKGEWNAVRRRETGAWRSTKLKRKNGMPERGIKRRHTVGGTKDFDKDGWSVRPRHTRTSSPDLTAAAVWPAPLVPPPRPPLESHV